MNANYIDGYRKQNAYIATQGSLPETFGDFWRMIWEQRSATVVMMTKLEERSRVRLHTYPLKKSSILESLCRVFILFKMQPLLSSDFLRDSNFEWASAILVKSFFKTLGGSFQE